MNRCPPALLINIVVVWAVVRSFLYLLRPLTAGLPMWAATLIVVPPAVVVIRYWAMPTAMKLRKNCGNADNGADS